MASAGKKAAKVLAGAKKDPISGEDELTKNEKKTLGTANVRKEDNRIIVTVPAAVLDRLNLSTENKVRFSLENGKVVLSNGGARKPGGGQSAGRKMASKMAGYGGPPVR